MDIDGEAKVDDEAALIGAVRLGGRRPIRVIVEIAEVVLLSDLVIALLLGDVAADYLAQQIVGITKRAPA